jgi:hypothetical protein
MYSSTGGTQINYLVIVSLLLSGVLGAVAAASAGGRDTYIEVGGLPKSQKEASTGSDSGRRIDKPQTGFGSPQVPDTSRRLDNSLSGGGNLPIPDSGGLVEKPQTGGGGTTIPWSNSGVFPTDLGKAGQPANQFCSSRDVTIGPDSQSRLHCSNTVGGTLRQ